jgi:hypothetical protein
LEGLNQALGGHLGGALEKWRTSTRSARLWTVLLDPNLDEYLRRRQKASVVPKVEYSIDQVAFKLESQAFGMRAGGTIDKKTTLGPFCSAFDLVARSRSPILP